MDSTTVWWDSLCVYKAGEKKKVRQRIEKEERTDGGRENRRERAHPCEVTKPHCNRKPRKVIACKGGFPDLIRKMISHGVKVINQNTDQGVCKGVV